MTRSQTLLLSLALAPASLLAQFYTYSDPFTSISGTYWVTNGTISGGTGGLTATTSGGGSVIYNSSISGPAGEYEIATTITLNTSCTSSCGTYVSYLNASSGALATGSSNTGSFYDIELQNPVFSGGSCSATLAFNKYASSTFSTLSTATVGCNSGMVIRAVHIGGAQFIVYLNNVWALYVSDSTLTGGQPGVGARGTPSGSSIAQGQIAPLDTTVPNGINMSLIGTSSFYDRVDIQSPGTTDNYGGSGIEGYQFYRNGSYLSNPRTANFSDTTVSPGTTYTYQILAFDYHLNAVGSSTFTVVTPASGGVDPRRVGLRPTGAYWGGSPEQIDILSGNLNFSLPLLKAQGRNGMGVGIALSYNSQNWRNDPGGTWDLGRDVGYGYGWKLLAGSLTPYWSSYYVLDHWTFTDSTGAEYRLDTNTSGVWTSSESVYLAFDSNTDTLHFPDGSFWVMGAVSAGVEQDVGTYYPTVMENSNGGQIILNYQTGEGAGWTNSSARITTIEDVRAVNDGYGHYWTYQFSYSSGHLSGIVNSIGTGEHYSFTYYMATTLSDPFSSTSYGTVHFLQYANVEANYTDYVFGYDGSSTPSSGNLTQVVLPYKGSIYWAYSNINYVGSRYQQEVGVRYLSKDGSTFTAYPILHESGTSYLTAHACTLIVDPGGVGEKYWAFPYLAADPTLVTHYQGRANSSSSSCSSTPASVALTQNDFTWTQDSAGNSYISQVDTTADIGTGNAIAKRTTQTVDVHGNVTQVANSNWGSPSTAARTYSYSYLSSGSYPSSYIFNRLTSATLTDGTTTLTLASLGYDAYSLSGSATPREWDSAYGSVTVRGNVTSMTDISGNTTTVTFDKYGNTASTTVNGVTSTASSSGTTNYAAPESITVGSTLTTSMSYNSFLGLTNESGPNGTSIGIGYDATARPTSSTSPFGATTTTVYNDTATPHPNVCTSLSTRWTQTFLDGLGRPLQSWTGSYSSSGPTTCSSASGAVTLTRADTTYDSCGCSPLGKMMSQTVPYAFDGTTGSATAATSYTYDAIGRTLTATAADLGGATTGTTAYSYAGNTVTVTDAGSSTHWKTFTMDAFGNLTQVTEPKPTDDPASGSNYVSTYGYDLMNHLISVSMARPGITGTQTRSFTYSGNQLTYATNPENGTVHYIYNTSGYGIGKIHSKTDAKNQEVDYTYDSLSRLSEVQRYPTSGGAEDTCQRETYTYGTSSTSYDLGRLVSVQYMGGWDPTAGLLGTGACDTTFTETYTYGQPGAPVSKTLGISRSGSYSLGATFSYDTEGRMTGETYPTDAYGATASLSYTFDSMGRLNTMTDNTLMNTVVTAASYGPANEMLSMTGGSYLGAWAGESRSYNSLKQLTGINSGSTVSIAYHYPSTYNNGKIDYQLDNISGEKVSYAYDELNRLETASTQAGFTPAWSQGFSYDGFGNLTQVNGSSIGSYNYKNLVGTEDANGNPPSIELPAISSPASAGYDVENRSVSLNPGFTGGPLYYYSYAPTNKRVWRGSFTYTYSMGTYTYTRGTDEITFLSVSGKKLGTYQITAGVGLVQTGTNYYFGSKLIKNNNGWVYSDRLGSNGKYYPYGEERPSVTTNDTEKFTGYVRDAATGIDYADQRYISPGAGRFLTPDRGGSPKLGNPGSWNKYAYVGGDPINRTDPSGKDVCLIDTGDYTGCDIVGPDQNGVCWVLTALGSLMILEAGDLGCLSVAWGTPDTFDSTGGPFNQIPSAPPSGGGGPGKMTQGNTSSAVLDLLYAFGTNYYNCSQVIGGAGLAGYLKVQGKVVNMTFYAGTDPYRMNLMGGPDNETFTSFHSANLSVAASTLVDRNLQPTWTFVLWADFYANTADGQVVTLIHEFLHSFTGMDHADIAAKYGITVTGDLTKDQTYSDAIDQWIRNKCSN